MKVKAMDPNKTTNTVEVYKTEFMDETVYMRIERNCYSGEKFIQMSGDSRSWCSTGKTLTSFGTLESAMAWVIYRQFGVSADSHEAKYAARCMVTA